MSLTELQSYVRIYIGFLESYPSKVQEEFPIFTVHPSPKITTESYEFNYTCSTDEIYGDVAYQWNKVDLVSRVLKYLLTEHTCVTLSY